jgi:hypothetical protein
MIIDDSEEYQALDPILGIGVEMSKSSLLNPSGGSPLLSMRVLGLKYVVGAKVLAFRLGRRTEADLISSIAHVGSILGPVDGRAHGRQMIGLRTAVSFPCSLLDPGFPF